MESILNQTNTYHHRLKSFKGSAFEKNRKCSAKKMAEAGLYFCPTENEPDMVKCYACGIEIHGWNKATDDPWTMHEKESPNCFYLKIKTEYSHKLTVYEFLEIEKHRYLKLNDDFLESKMKAIKQVLEKIENMNSDHQIQFDDESDMIQIEPKKA